MPKLYIIAGCNGAGKTTASFTVLPEMLRCREFVNADEIAKGMSPFNPEKMAIDAGRIMLQRIDELIDRGEDFAFETTLATRTYVNLIRKAHECGYFVSLLFFWLPTPEQAVERVAQRVGVGGHNISISTIYRRYESGLRNLFRLYIPICNYWVIYDNSNVDGIRKIALGRAHVDIRGDIKSGKREVLDEVSYAKIERYERD